jgi:hypothetical protein
MSNIEKIICTRYDEESGVENERVRGALLYAFGLAGGRMEEYCGIIKLHDQKGCLEACWQSYEEYKLYSKYISRAWREFANEYNVEHYFSKDGIEYSIEGDNPSGRRLYVHKAGF